VRINKKLSTAKSEAHKIQTPYDLVPWSAKSTAHLAIIETWRKHLERKNRPYIVEETETTARLITQQSCRVLNGYVVPVKQAEDCEFGYFGDHV